MSTLRLVQALTLAAMTVLAALPGDARACGRIADWIARYDAAQSDENRLGALRELASWCGDYAGRRSDVGLYRVLKDAMARGLDRSLLRTVFVSYHCVSGQRDDPGYRDLVAGLDVSAENCPAEATTARWMVANANGVLVRERAARDGQKLGWLDRGMIVERLNDSGEWLRAHGGISGLCRRRDFTGCLPPRQLSEV